MGMPLHDRIDTKVLQAAACPEGAYSFLSGLDHMVLRMDEVHGHDAQDDSFIFLIWGKDMDVSKLMVGIQANIRRYDDPCWTVNVSEITEGLLMVTSVLHG